MVSAIYILRNQREYIVRGLNSHDFALDRLAQATLNLGLPQLVRDERRRTNLREEVPSRVFPDPIRAPPLPPSTPPVITLIPNRPANPTPSARPAHPTRSGRNRGSIPKGPRNQRNACFRCGTAGHIAVQCPRFRCKHCRRFAPGHYNSRCPERRRIPEPVRTRPFPITDDYTWDDLDVDAVGNITGEPYGDY
ncbi:hypothetical protein PQX77_017780 [Marasmius sp. AFHP31]|nr:hypothetical protein PQX77_017780 [Marasmius sp. AFHP31]